MFTPPPPLLCACCASLFTHVREQMDRIGADRLDLERKFSGAMDDIDKYENNIQTLNEELNRKESKTDGEVVAAKRDRDRLVMDNMALHRQNKELKDTIVEVTVKNSGLERRIVAHTQNGLGDEAFERKKGAVKRKDMMMGGSSRDKVAEVEQVERVRVGFYNSSDDDDDIEIVPVQVSIHSRL